MAHLATGRCALASVRRPVDRGFCVGLDGFWTARGLVGWWAGAPNWGESVRSLGHKAKAGRGAGRSS
jgi:hypothetical protein